MNEHVLAYWKVRIHRAMDAQDDAISKMKIEPKHSPWIKYFDRRIDHYDRVIEQLIAKRRREYQLGAMQ